MKKEKAEVATGPFTITEDQERYHKSIMKTVGPYFAIVFVRIAAYENFAEDDLDELVRKIFRTYAIKS